MDHGGMNAGLMLRSPESLVGPRDVDEQCAAIEAWAEHVESVPELRDASNKLAAIDEYLSRTSTDGRARVAAAMRRLEVRIGELLPREQGKRTDLLPDRGEEVLNERQKSDFRRMAEHPEVVEEVIAESTDEKPASRRSVLQKLEEAKKKFPADPPPFKSAAGVKARVEQAKKLAAEGHTSEQIARRIGISPESMGDFRKRHGVEVPADQALLKSRRIDSDRIVSETVSSLEGIAYAVRLLGDDLSDLNAEKVAHWVASLSDSIRPINRLIKALKEINP